MTYEIIKEEILDLGSDNLVVFGGKYEGGIHLQQNISEITNLILFLIKEKDRLKNFLEVGSASGGNTFVLNKYLNFENIVIVDDNKHPKHNFRPDVLKNYNYIEFIGDSQKIETIQQVKDLNIEFDLIFIDADHSYEGVKNDTYNYVNFLKNDGYIILHDTVCCDGILKWSNELKNSVIENMTYVSEFIFKDNSWPKGISIFKKIIK